MKNKTEIAIPQPCPKQWSSMTPSEGGRHCSHCAKTVIDFTQLTDAELLSIFNRPTTGICGRFHENQLNRALHIPQQQAARSWKSAFLAAGLLFFQAKKSSAALPVPDTHIEYNRAAEKRLGAMHRDTMLHTIKGRVIDESSKLGVAGAVIEIRDTKIATVTDAEGNYLLAIPESITAYQVNIRVLSVGYNNIDVSIDRRKQQDNYNFNFTLAGTLNGEVVVVGGAFGKKKRWWKFWKW